MWKGASLDNRAAKLTRATTEHAQTAILQKPITRLCLLEYFQCQHTASVTSCPVSEPCSKAEHARVKMITRISLMDKSMTRFVFPVIFFLRKTELKKPK